MKNKTYIKPGIREVKRMLEVVKEVPPRDGRVTSRTSPRRGFIQLQTRVLIGYDAITTWFVSPPDSCVKLYTAIKRGKIVVLSLKLRE